MQDKNGWRRKIDVKCAEWILEWDEEHEIGNGLIIIDFRAIFSLRKECNGICSSVQDMWVFPVQQNCTNSFMDSKKDQ